jgi:hypothetical protein
MINTIVARKPQIPRGTTMAIDGGRVVPLFTAPGTTFDSATVNLGTRRFFVAWITINWDDPLRNYDRDNAIAADIFVDGSPTAVRAFNGDHFGPLGPPGSPNFFNVFQGAVATFGQRITFFLRVFGPDIAAGAEGVVVF